MFRLQNIGKTGVVGIVQEVVEPIEGTDDIYIDSLPPIVMPPNTSTVVLYYIDNAAIWKPWANMKPEQEIKLPPDIELFSSNKISSTTLFTVAVDSNDYLRTGGLAALYYYLTPTGTQISGGGSGQNVIQQMLIDNSDNYYMACNDFSVRKQNPTGNDIWANRSNTAAVITIALGTDLAVYSGGDDNSLRKLSSVGALVWTTPGIAGIRSIATDLQNNIFVGGYETNVIKYNSSGAFVWATFYDFPIQSITADNEGNSYCGGNDGIALKFSQNGAIIARYDTGAIITTVILDKDKKSIYYSGHSQKIFKLDLAFNLIYSYQLPPGAWIEKMAMNSKNQIIGAMSNGNIEIFQQNYGGILFDKNEEMQRVYKKDLEIKTFTPKFLTYNWVKPTLHYANSITSDENNNIYLGDSSGVISKLTVNGDVVFSSLICQDKITQIERDKKGDIFCSSADKTVRKLSPEGNEIWKFTGHIQPVHSVAIDELGYIYSGSGNSGSGNLIKLSQDGIQVENIIKATYNIVTDKKGFMYVCHSDSQINKKTLSGITIWSNTASAAEYTRLIVSSIDGSSFVSYGGKYSSYGIKISSTSHITSCAVNVLGDIYYCVPGAEEGSFLGKLSVDNVHTSHSLQNSILAMHFLPNGDFIFCESQDYDSPYRIVSQNSSDMTIKKRAYYN